MRVFMQLYQDSKTDAEKATKLQPDPLPGRNRKAFEAALSSTGNLFTVYSTDGRRRPIEFSLRENRIEVQTASDLLALTIALDNQGKCKIRVNKGDELDGWQVRKMVLEELFFD